MLFRFVLGEFLCSVQNSRGGDCVLSSLVDGSHYVLFKLIEL